MKTTFKSIICIFFFSQNLLATNVSGTISADVTWTLANSPYVLTGDILVADEITLTIEPGVVIEFNSSLRDLFVDGNIQAIGNSTDSILFIGVGSAARGDVIIRNTGVLEVSTFAFCVFENMAGGQASGAAVRLDVPAIIQNCRFNNDRDAVADADALGSIENTNQLEEIRIQSNSLDSTAIFPNADSDGFHYLMLGDQTIADSNVLTIEPGVEVRFSSTLHEFYINGKLIANGTSTDSISFIGVNPNNGGIRLANSGVVDTSEFSFCNFKNLGSAIMGSALEVYQPCFLSNSTFNNTLDIKADADFLESIDESNRLEEIRILSSTLSSTTTWPVADETGFVYVINGDQVISDGTVLTIEPGVAMEFRSSLTELLVNGRIIAEGTSTDSIIFKAATNKQGGIWLRNDGAIDTSVFKYCIFDSLGSILLNDNTLNVSHPVILTNSQFNAERDIIADADFVWGINNTNRLDVIDLASSSLDSTTIWPNANETGFIYRTLGDQTVEEGTVLSIEAGNEIQFISATSELYINGQLLAEGTSADSIKFIGEVPNDGSVYVVRNGTIDTSIFSYCSFKDLGSIIVNVGLRLDDPALVSNCFFSNARDVLARADKVWGFESSNRLKEIELLSNSLAISAHWPVADDTGFNYKMLGDLRLPVGELLTIEEGVEVLQNSVNTELYIRGQMNLLDNVPGKEVRFYRE